MKLDGFRLVSYEAEADAWFQSSPYRALLFLSCVGDASRARLTSFLNDLGLDDLSLSRELAASIADALLRGGQAYEIRERHYASLPPYTVEKSTEEWIVLGDARVDSHLRDSSGVLEVSSAVEGNSITLERSYLAEPDDASSTFESIGIRPFRRVDLLSLVPEVESLVAPIAWSNFDPGTFGLWEFLGSEGTWLPIDSPLKIPEGLCRGIAQDSEGRVVARKYFYRQSHGWSPVTADDASLWVLQAGTRRGKPLPATYNVATETLTVGAWLPHAAYTALRYLGIRSRSADGHLLVEGIPHEDARAVCEKLGLALSTEGER